MISRPMMPRRNQKVAARPLYPLGLPSLFSTLCSMELTAAIPTAEPSWSAPLKIAPTVPAMDEGEVRKIAMLEKMSAQALLSERIGTYLVCVYENMAPALPRIKAGSA